MKKLVYLFGLGVLLLKCSNPSTVEPDVNGLDPEDPTRIDLLQVNLQFPHKDGLCNIGADITPTESTVFFEWKASSIAESYVIYVTNLVDGSQIEARTSEDKIGIRLSRATPYSWYVISSSGTASVESETWKFYNSGPGVETYAPFPATLVAPVMASSVNAGTVSLTWTGSDVDEDIVGYDVYLGLTNEPEMHSSNITTNQIDVVVTSGNIYYWRIVTKDEIGNTSESAIFQFKVL